MFIGRGELYVAVTCIRFCIQIVWIHASDSRTTGLGHSCVQFHDNWKGQCIVVTYMFDGGENDFPCTKQWQRGTGIPQGRDR